MRASLDFLATLKDTPAEAAVVSHRLMLRAGMIQQVAAGIYAWLPMGLRALRRIEAIVRQEQDRIGAIEVLAPTLQPAHLWQESGRYEDYGDEMLRLRDRANRDLVYGPTAEEVFTELFRTHIHSYKDLPQCLYNIQWKFRDERRPRFGLMRGREFLMKDAYSFDLTIDGAKKAYQRMFTAYMHTFKRMGLRAIAVRAATGPIGGDLSHEFHILANTGESELFYDGAMDDYRGNDPLGLQNFYAMADDQHNPATCPVPIERLKTARGIEIGHIFYFGTKYSKAMNAMVTDSAGQRVPVEMGSYGIGVSRLVAAIIEASHDDAGIIWPTTVAPYPVAIAALNQDADCLQGAKDLYAQLCEQRMSPYLYDLDRRAGEIFADLDLLGFPFQVIYGRQWKEGRRVEVKIRATGERLALSLDELETFLASSLGFSTD
jgi:prolyl-tRNA synthetase